MSTINYRVFRSQFYIGPKPKALNESWKSVSLSNGLFLSYDTDLPVRLINNNQRQYVLLGTAVQSLEGHPAPDEVLSSITTTDNLQQLYASWAGRWVLLAGTELHLDAGGLLGCYYRKSASGVEVASAPGLITNSPVPDTFRLIKSGGAEFYPPPHSGFKQVFKVLPSQVLQLQTGDVAFRNLQCFAPELDYNETIAYLARLLSTTLKNAFGGKPNQRILLALTGGYDSRTLMAALNYSNLPYEAITFCSPNIRPSDASIPKQLAQISGKKAPPDQAWRTE